MYVQPSDHKLCTKIWFIGLDIALITRLFKVDFNRIKWRLHFRTDCDLEVKVVSGTL